jgi:hypothetical protein
MKVRGLLVAAVLLAALSGVLWWSNKKKAAEEAKPDTSATPKLVDIPQTQVTKVSITHKGSPAVVLEKAGGQWKITSPESYGADQDTVNSLLSSLNPLNADKLVEDHPSEVAQFGLKDPSLTVAVTTTSGRTTTILAGDDLPTGGSTYAELAGDSKVYTIPSYAKSGLDKSVNDLRDKRLLTFDSDKITRVDLTAKGKTVEFGKNNQNEWQILEPKPMRADGLQVDELVRKLKGARMDLSVSAEDSKKAAAAFAGGIPVAEAKVTDAGGTQTLTVKKDKAGDYYAKSSVVVGVFKVTSDLGSGVDKTLDDFRNKKLFDFGFNEPNHIDIQDGPKSYSLQRNGEDWFQNGKKVDNLSVQNLIDKLRDLTAARFVDSGFGTPTIHINIVSNGGKKTEKAAFAASGAGLIGQREGETSLYSVDGKSMKDIEQAASDVKPAQEKKK